MSPSLSLTQHLMHPSAISLIIDWLCKYQPSTMNVTHVIILQWRKVLDGRHREVFTISEPPALVLCVT